MRRNKKATTKHSSGVRSEEHTSELQSPCNLVCRLLLEEKSRHGVRSHSRNALPTFERRADFVRVGGGSPLGLARTSSGCIFDALAASCIAGHLDTARDD